MRVALALDGLAAEPAGVGRYIRELARHLPGGIEELRFALCGRLREARAVAELLRPAGAGVGRRHSDFLRRTLLSNATLARLAQDALDWSGRALPRRFGVDVVHGPKYYLPPLHDARGVVTFHDLSTIDHPQWHAPGRAARVTRAMEHSVSRAARIITDSEAVRREVIGHFGLAEAQVVAVPLGVDPRFRPLGAADCAPFLERHGLTRGNYMLSVATLEPRKNLVTVLRAYRNLPPALRRRLPLVLAGALGWRSDDLRQHIDQGVSEGWLRWLGYVEEDELPPLYASARGFLFFSHYEGFGLPVLEAMASGVPVVASQLAVLVEVCGDCALYADPMDSGAISTLIGRCAEDQAWVRHAAALGLMRASTYTWQECARKTVAVYEQARLA